MIPKTPEGLAGDDRRNLNCMLQRIEPANSSEQPSDNGEAAQRPRASTLIEKAFPQFLVIAILLATPLLRLCSLSRLDQCSRRGRDTKSRMFAMSWSSTPDGCSKTHELAALATRDRIRRAPAAQPDDLRGFLFFPSPAPSPEIASISVIDAEGQLLASSAREADAALSFADAGWFRRLRDGEMSRVVEADPAQNAIAQGLFTLSFRHDDPEGGFDGAVRLAISPGYFNIFHSDIAPEQRGWITLFHENGEMLSRYPPDVANGQRSDAG